MNVATAPKAATPRLLSVTLSALRTAMVAVVVFSFFINLLLLTGPLYMLQVFDRVITSGSTETLFYLTLIAAAALLALSILEAVRGRVMLTTSTWIDRRLGGPILRANVGAIQGQGEGPTAQGLRDLSSLRSFLTGPSVFPILDAPWAPIFIVVIFLLHPYLGWLALAGAALLLALALANEWATRSLLQNANDANAKALRHAEAAARNADVIQSMGMMPNLIGHWGRRNDQTLALQGHASRRMGNIMAATKFVRTFLQIGLLGTGAWLVLQDAITPGAMIASSILTARALAPVDGAIGAWRSIVGARQSYRRISAILSTLPQQDQAMTLPAPLGVLHVEQATFAHPGATHPVLRNIEFQIEAGEALGVIGPTATGKTTLARLLVGNLHTIAGHVRLDGADIAQWDKEDLGPHIGYLPQDIELFSGTVHDNIARLGQSDPEQVVAAAKLAGVHELILDLPDGYDTEIGDGGTVLSGGQRQRLALARAVYGHPKFVILDEPNASLDQEGDKALIDAMQRMREDGTTLVIVSHRPSILRSVDKILVLGSGTVQMFGPRDEVLAKVTGLGAAPNQPQSKIVNHPMKDKTHA